MLIEIITIKSDYMQPLISVIVPNYNHAQFLRERLDSILNQTYENIEVIILDDHSTDNSVDVIKHYELHPKIKRIEINNVNSGNTFIQWEKGFRLAEGKYIWIAESDDVADFNFLKILIAAIDNDDSIVMALSKIQVVDQFGNCKSVLEASKSKSITKKNGLDFINRSLYFGNHLYNASSMLFRREALSNISKDYMQLRSSGDYLFYLELAIQGNVVEVPEVLDYFRRHSTNVTPKLYASGEAFYDAFKVYQYLQRAKIARGLKRVLLVGLRLWQIDSSNSFNSLRIKEDIYNLWKKEVRFPYVTKMLFSIGRFFRNILVAR